MTDRKAEVSRKTYETDIQLSLNVDGNGEADISTGIGFFDHMLTLLTRHALFNMTISARGDLAVDGHHTVEDIGICLGQALKAAMEDKSGITRYGTILIPMDEALARIALDISGRPHLDWRVEMPTDRVGLFDTSLAREFFKAICSNAGLNMHVELIYGEDSHHCLEALFKGLGRVLRTALTIDPREPGVPSTKGTL